MTKRVLLRRPTAGQWQLAPAMLRLTTAWNQALVLPAEGVLITVAKEKASAVCSRGRRTISG